MGFKWHITATLMMTCHRVFKTDITFPILQLILGNEVQSSSSTQWDEVRTDWEFSSATKHTSTELWRLILHVPKRERNALKTLFNVMCKMAPCIHQFIRPLAEGGLIIFKVNYCLVAMLIIKESAYCWSDCSNYYSSNCLDSIYD